MCRKFRLVYVGEVSSGWSVVHVKTFYIFGKSKVLQGSRRLHGFVLFQAELSSLLSLLGILHVSLQSLVIVAPNLAHVGIRFLCGRFFVSSLETTKHSCILSRVHDVS